jgi:hydroxypyruvate reductase
MTDATDPRALARALYDAAVRAADPGRALEAALAGHPLPRPEGRTYVIGIGKAAPRMVATLLPHIDGPCRALAVTHHENRAEVPGARVLRAGHPVPDEAGAAAAREAMAMLDQAGPDDAVIALISGGGSALVPAPVPPLTLADKKAVNEALLAGGLDIVAMNLVRQQLSELKGGGFLRHAAPASVSAYILSDVIGDDLRAVASGPTVGPVGTAEDACATLKKAGLWDCIPAAARRRLTDAPPPEPLPEATNVLIGSNRHALDAMAATAEEAGLSTRVVNDALVGDVADAAAEILDSFDAPEGPRVLLFGGETTVTIRGDGCGGRNQELALRVAMGARAPGRRWAFLSGGTDGRDGPTDAAGGIVDAGTAGRISEAGGDAAALLANNDSYRALDLAGDLLKVEATGTNVADVQALVLL